MLFGHKNKVQVDLGDLENEEAHLVTFLNSNLKVDFIADKGKLSSDSEKISLPDLQRLVTKFVYRRNLNSTHWVSLNGNVVKINKFKNENKKPEKQHKKSTSSSSSSITQSWGL